MSHSQTDAQPVSEQMMANNTKLHCVHVIVEHGFFWCGISFWFVQIISLVVLPHNVLCTLQMFTKGQSEKRRWP